MSTLDLKTLSKEDLLAEIQHREKEERKAEQALRNAYETDKKDFLEATAGKFQALNHEMIGLKEFTIREANNLYNRMYVINGREPKEVKSFTIKSDNDNVKLTVDRQERFVFTDEADVFIQAIKDFFRKKYAKRNKSLYAYFDDFLAKNTKGDYDPKELIKAKRKAKELGDVKLIELVDKLMDCQRIVGTSLYCRLYVRDQTTKKWKDVTLNFSSL